MHPEASEELPPDLNPNTRRSARLAKRPRLENPPTTLISTFDHDEDPIFTMQRTATIVKTDGVYRVP